MPIHQPYVIRAVTPGSSLDICYWKAEDSGYHTSYTPSLLECSKISLENQLSKDISLSSQKPVLNRTARKSDSGFQTQCDCIKESPSNRRGVKRLFQERCLNEDNSYNLLTPTSLIAGKLHTLQFNEENQLDSNFAHSNSQDVYSNLYYNNNLKCTPFPSTPIKKKCRSSCKENSSLNSNRLLKYDDYAAHSITCERRALQPIRKLVKVFKHRPNKKIDIIQMLYQNQGITPPLIKIFSYLTDQDRQTVKQVSSIWKEIYEVVWETISRKNECHNFPKKSIDNIENEDKHLIYASTPRSHSINQSKPLIEIQNIQLNHQDNNTSPPTSPSTTRFKRYTKVASLDSREQLPCVRCHQPSKLTREKAGEEWAQCMSTSCSFQFCKLCLCERHPGKICVKFDLDGPSPSKRKKKAVAIGTRQSRKNLRRLL